MVGVFYPPLEGVVPLASCYPVTTLMLRCAPPLTPPSHALTHLPHRLFESVAPLLPDLVGRLSADIAPFCSVGGLRFITPDEAGGPWRNYFVGLVGSVAADEDDILWPNQVHTVTVGLLAGFVLASCWFGWAADEDDILWLEQPGWCRSVLLHTRAASPSSPVFLSHCATRASPPTPPSPPYPPTHQVLHRDRILFNVRNGWDVAKFLSDPQKEDVEAHRDNLVRIAAERGYRRGWCWHMLRLRWGGATLAALGLEV